MFFVTFLVLIVPVLSLPVAKDMQMMDLGNVDTALVESTIREVRAAPDSEVVDLLQSGTKGAYLHEYGDAGDDVHGYHKRHEEKGSDGYKHFDSYHKKDGDKYGYEKHSAFGKAKKNLEEAGEDNGKHQEDDGDHAKYQDETEAEAESGEETKNTYKVVEELDEGDVDDGPAHYTGNSGGEHAEGEAEENSGESSGRYTNDDDGSYHYHEEESPAHLEGGNVDHEDDGGNYDGHYTSGDHENVEYADDGGSSAESGHYTAENEEDDGDY